MSNMASDAKACFSSKVEYRAIIRNLYLKGKTGKKIHGELADVYGSSASSYAQVKRNGFELILHSAHLPDLAPSEVFLFPNLTRAPHAVANARLHLENSK